MLIDPNGMEISGKTTTANNLEDNLFHFVGITTETGLKQINDIKLIREFPAFQFQVPSSLLLTYLCPLPGSISP